MSGRKDHTAFIHSFANKITILEGLVFQLKQFEYVQDGTQSLCLEKLSDNLSELHEQIKEYRQFLYIEENQ
jgi:hypothetical protein